jgi:hypothetical protein
VASPTGGPRRERRTEGPERPSAEGPGRAPREEVMLEGSKTEKQGRES